MSAHHAGMRLIAAMAALALAGCVEIEAEPTPSGPVTIVTVPSRLFAAAGDRLTARIEIAEGTPVIGSTVHIRSSTQGSAIACIDNQCSTPTTCDRCAIPIRIPVRRYASGDVLAIVVQGRGISVDGALVALDPGSDPL